MAYDREELVESLSKHAERMQADGLEIELRNCADRERGKVDPRSAAACALTREDFAERRDAIHPELRANETHLLGLKNPEGRTQLELLRAQFGWTSSDLSTGIRTLCRKLQGIKGEFGLYQYERISDEKERPCFIFIHGGGYFGGDIATVENQCKLLAQMIGGVVFSVDYPLSPEHPFPEGVEACYAAVKWVYANAKELGISRRKIGIGGDSAGGTFSLVCALRDGKEKEQMLSYEALIYPGVVMVGSMKESGYWKEEDYENPSKDPLIDKEIRAIEQIADDVAAWYLPEGTDETQPDVSPLLADLSKLPKTLVFTAEYDFLRGSCEAFSRKLGKAGVEQRHIRYGGIFHGTFDRLGYAPQVEDMLREIAKDMRSL